MSDPSFSVVAACCTYKQVLTKAVIIHNKLEKCPDPKITVHYQDGDALIGRSRSLTANNFLFKDKSDMLMFLDEDIIITTEDATKIMWEAWKLDLPIIGAAYPTKSKENPSMAVRPLKKHEQMEFGKTGKLYEMEYISTGCMCIRREVFQKMLDTEKIKSCKGVNGRYYPFFQDVQMEIDGEWEHLSEDWFFCKIARELGFSIWCDTTIKLGHVGPYEYTWDDLIEIKNGSRKKYDVCRLTPDLNGKSDAEKNKSLMDRILPKLNLKPVKIWG